MVVQALRARGLLARARTALLGTPARAGATGFAAGSIAGIDVPNPTGAARDLLMPAVAAFVAGIVLLKWGGS